jgi:NTP pyrophosphatase (non-canonical NTP hydrolase)
VHNVDYDAIAANVNSLVADCFRAAYSSGWWTDLATGQSLIGAPRMIEQKLVLIHSEVSEAMEGHRKNLMDDKLPNRAMLEVELADAVIRICDLAGAYNLDLGGAVAEKMYFNSKRADHRIENRTAENGKKY